MRFLPSLFSALLMFGALGCDENLDPATPEGALRRVRDAVIKKDASELLACSTVHTNELLAQLQTMIQEQRTAIEEKYPPEHQDAARLAYPQGIFEARDSIELFTLLTQKAMSELGSPEGIRSGFRTQGSPLSSNPSQKLFTTKAGENIEFVLEDGKWKTNIFETALSQNVQRLQVNQETLEKNLKAFEELKRRAEPGTPGEAAPGSAPDANAAGR